MFNNVLEEYAASIFRVEVKKQTPDSSQMLVTVYFITCKTRIVYLYNAFNPVEAAKVIFSYQT
jgi:hypothetical protein